MREESPGPAPLLRMEGIRKSFGAARALDGVDLRVNAGEVLALVGENGAGKSTAAYTASIVQGGFGES
jgi:ABC-type sugar transport system ATPase subunit